MKRLLTLLAVVALAGSACAYGGTPTEPAALSVGDAFVSTSTLRDELEYLEANPDAMTALVGQEIPVTGSAPGSYEPSAVATVLNLHLQSLVLAELIDEAGAEVGEEARAAAKDQVDSVFSGMTIPASLESSLIELVAADSALNDAIWADVEVPEEQIEEGYEAIRADRVEVCASHILVSFASDPSASRDPSFTPSDEQVAAAEERIEAIEARLDAGEDFATVAGEESDDTGSAAQGGELGCGPANGYVEGFAEAVATQEIGEVGDRVETQFGYHLVVVDERTEPTLDDLREELVQSLGGTLAQERFGELLETVGARVEIRLDPRFGTVDEESMQITPPQGAQDAPTLSEDPVFDPELFGG